MTNVGKSGIGLLLGPSGTIPDFIAVGSGSGAVAITNTDLIAETNGAAFTSTDISTEKQITWIADFSSVTMSGTALKEFGVKVSGLNTWNREGFANIDFDGTNELQIEVTFEIF